MKKIILSLLFYSIYITGFSQQPKKTYNFSNVDTRHINQHSLQKKIEAENKRIEDSLKNNSLLDSLQQLDNFINRKRNNFGGFEYSTEFPSAKLDKVNKELGNNGFPPLSVKYVKLGLGFVFKHNRWIHDLTLVAATLTKKTAANNTTVKILEANYFNYTIGYDLVNLPRLHIYPFAGLYYQNVNLSVEHRS